MQVQSARQLLFGNLTDRSVLVKRANVEMTSDAGLIPIREFDRKWRLTERMVECLADQRSRSQHSMEEMLRQRLFGILADYEDCNDHDDLRTDPLFKIIAGRCPVEPQRGEGHSVTVKRSHLKVMTDDGERIAFFYIHAKSVAACKSD